MPQQPSRRDLLGPPPRDLRDVASVVRHLQSYLHSLDPGYLDGRWATPQPVPGGPSLLVGGDEGGGEAEDNSVVGEDGDRLTLTNLGDQTWTLSFVPIAETLHVHWHPDAGAGVEWKRGEHYFIDDDDNVVTIYASALVSAKAEVGDMFSAQYLRLEGEQEAADEVDGIDWGSTGPMLTVTEGSTTDYSDPDFDDSGWTEAAAPGGHPTGPTPADPDWLPVVYDTASTNAGFWMRRTFSVPIAGEVTIRNRVDGRFWLYCDGVLVNVDASAGTLGEFDVQVELDPGEHVIAYHVDDDTSDPGGDYLYGDIKVEVPQ